MVLEGLGRAPKTSSKRAYEIRRAIILERSEPLTSEAKRSFNHKVFASTEASKARDRVGFGLPHRKENFQKLGRIKPNKVVLV